jgi:hypothetical protein
MIYSLPEIGKAAIPLPHFPTRHQAFIFRAYEYFDSDKIADILGTSKETVEKEASAMGLPKYDKKDVWQKKGYITIIRRMWHILPYEQLMKLLELDEAELATIMREEDFLDFKLGKKPICEPVVYRELTKEEKEKTEKIKRVMNSLDFSGVFPFDFKYSVPQIHFEGKERFGTRIIYAFSSLYLHAFDVPSEDFLPDEQLRAYQALGINGIWTQGVLSMLSEFPFAPEVSSGYEKRIERMRELTERLDKYGIKLYLYINEPRAMPLAFFDRYPHLKGHEKDGQASLCTSTEEVKNYLQCAIESICKSVPKIGGFFTITRSENQTNCYSHSGDLGIECTCPRCKERTPAEVISEVINCICEGAHRVNPDIKVFAWSWMWRDLNKDIIPRLSRDVIMMSQSELHIPFKFGDTTGIVRDYSMSIIGPGEYAKNEWKIAKERGLQLASKVQINTTWEASTVPALPLSPSIDEHIRRLRDEGVEHLLLSWTLGGYPCKNIAVAAKHFFEHCDFSDEGSSTYEAEKQFVEAFKEFPFEIRVLYNGPQNAGPSTLLFEEPTGYRSTMTCFAYDALDEWCGIYPADTFENQFALLCEKWEKGLSLLPEEENETVIMAHAAYCLFKASLNQIRFIRARDDGRYEDAASIAESELEISKKMLSLMNKNASIGYEAANHYYFSRGQMAEKILNCHYIIDAFRKKAREK